MNWRRWLVALFVILVLAGCVSSAAGSDLFEFATLKKHSTHTICGISGISESLGARDISSERGPRATPHQLGRGAAIEPTITRCANPRE